MRDNLNLLAFRCAEQMTQQLINLIKYLNAYRNSLRNVPTPYAARHQNP